MLFKFHENCITTEEMDLFEGGGREKRVPKGKGGPYSYFSISIVVLNMRKMNAFQNRSINEE